MKTTAQKAFRLLAAARNVAKAQNLARGGWEIKSRLEEITIYCDAENSYAEPGYSAEVVAIGNWNEIDAYNQITRSRDTISTLPKRLGDALERLGVQIEWSDQWSSCSDCGRLVRTDADAMSWAPYYAQSGIENGEIVCLDCADHAAECEWAETTDMLSRRIDPTAHGYVQEGESFDDLNEARDRANGLNVSRWLVQCRGRWDWRLYVHESECTINGTRGELLREMVRVGACDESQEWVCAQDDADDANEVVWRCDRADWIEWFAARIKSNTDLSFAPAVSAWLSLYNQSCDLEDRGE